MGVLRLVQPPEGVALLSSTPSKTGEGGQGVIARYSDGTTASAMVNSDGSVTVLFFRNGEMVPAIRVDGALDVAAARDDEEGADATCRFTWRPAR